MRKIFSLVAAVAAMSVVFSCEREESFEKAGSRMLGVEVAQDMTTKASDEYNGQSEPYIFDVNGEELYLTESVSAMSIETRPVETKGAPITAAGGYFNKFSLNFYRISDSGDGNKEQYHAPVTVSYASSEWSLAKNVYWPDNSDEVLNFYATNSANKGASQTVTETFPTDGGMHIVYADDGSSEDKAAMNETDLLYAYTKTDMNGAEKRDNDRAIGLTFHHALAGIKFNFGNVTNGLQLTNVTLSGIKTSGECDFKDGSFTWTPGDDANSLSQSFSSTTTDSSAGTSCDDADGTRTFFIIPQEISDDAKMTFTFVYELAAVSGTPSADYAGTGKTFTKTVKVKFKDIAAKCSTPYTEWKAGSLYTYSISGNLVFAELGYTIPDICKSMLSPAVDAASVKSVNFSVGETLDTKATLVTGPEVQSSRSLTKIYATFDSASGELTLHTTAPKIFAQPNSSLLFGLADTAVKKDGTSGHLINLTSISNLDKLDTRNVIDMSSMFCGCLSLETLDLTKFNTENVKSFYNMFRECHTLNENLVVTGFDTSNATNFSCMFYGCNAVQSLDVKGFNTAKVTNMGSMFGYCTALTSLDVTKFNTEKVTNMSGMFMWCTALTSLDLKTFNTSNVTNMSSMFLRCTALGSLDVTKFDTSKVNSMFRMFMDCWVLPSLDVTNFNTEKVTNMAEMFRTCSKLASIDVTGFNTAKVTGMYRMFEGCSSLTSLDVTKFDTSIVTSMANMFYGCSGLTSLDVTKFDTSSVTNMSYMFSGCSGLTSLDVTNFKTEKVTDMSYMFGSCGLTSLDVTNFNTEKVTTMEGMFSKSSGLTSLNLTAFNTLKVTTMKNMFYGCEALTSLDLSSFNTSNVTDMQGMFNDCLILPSLDISNFNTSKVTDMQYLFEMCWHMMTLTLGENFKLPADTSYTYHMFCGFAYSATDENKAKIYCTDTLATAIKSDASSDGNDLITGKVEFVAI